MDLVQTRLRSQLFNERTNFIRDSSESFAESVEFYATSIWDQSLYKAWTQIIYFLIPNAGRIENMLRQLAEVIDARELILYERVTCLMVTRVSRGENENHYHDRFERISSILKTHKQSMAKHTGIPAGSANFAELQIKATGFMFFITRLTENTNLAACIPPAEHIFNAARVNIALARPRFAELDVAMLKKKPVDEQSTSTSAEEGRDDRV